MREELVSGDGNTGTVYFIVDERVDWRRSWKKLVGGVKAEVSGSR